MKSFFHLFSVFAFLAMGGNLLPSLACGQDKNTLDYLKGLSIEDLLQTEITSVSKKTESLMSAAAAVTVITQEDIERTGARNIPEALRMVPGLSVAAIDGSRYAVGSRGFSDMFETKLLVLIDGRTMYAPLYSGVYWNSLDTIMQDIERIEVIRGPGATIWGANAVNGVINIITKNSKKAQGTMVAANVGNYDLPNISARYGGEIGEQSFYRVYAKGFKRENYENPDGSDAHDASSSLRSGFRIDSQAGNQDSLSVQGEVFNVDSEMEVAWNGSLIPPSSRVITGNENSKGGDLLGLWKHEFSETSATTLQFYYERSKLDREGMVVEVRDTINIDLKHHFQGLKDHDIVWGSGYRWTQDDLQGTDFTSFDPESREDHLWNGFIQDDINIIDDMLWFTIGTKIEHNSYTGWEIQPSARVRVQPNDTQTVWAAISRAVRTPSRADHDITINNNVTELGTNTVALTKILGSENFTSEEVISYELGYRLKASKELFFDLSSFYNVYEDLRTFDVGTAYGETEPYPHIVIPVENANNGKGTSYGFELQSKWSPSDTLQFIVGYSYIEIDLELADGIDEDLSQITSDEGSAPKHQANLRCYWDIADNYSFDTEIYYVSDLLDGQIDEYVRFDAQLSWQVTENLRLSVVGENMFSSGNQETAGLLIDVVPSNIPAQYWLKADFRY